MLMGSPPFEGTNLIAVATLLFSQSRPELSNLPDGSLCPAQLRELISDMMALKPSDRPDIVSTRSRIDHLSRDLN